MKKKISIVLSTEIRAEIDRQIGTNGSRSAFIEKTLRDHFKKLARDEIRARDVLLINANAENLNREAMDVLRYQADIFEVLEDQADTR